MQRAEEEDDTEEFMRVLPILIFEMQIKRDHHEHHEGEKCYLAERDRSVLK